jgi:hypothetical protein
MKRRPANCHQPLIIMHNNHYFHHYLSQNQPPEHYKGTGLQINPCIATKYSLHADQSAKSGTNSTYFLDYFVLL